MKSSHSHKIIIYFFNLQDIDNIMKNAMKEYSEKNIDLDKLAQSIINFFSEEGFKTQSAKHPNGSII